MHQIITKAVGECKKKNETRVAKQLKSMWKESELLGLSLSQPDDVEHKMFWI